MAPEDLDNILDTMQRDASAGPDAMPGLITVESSEWVNSLSWIRPTCSALHDGLRHRNIKIHVSSALATAVVPRSVAGDLGAPYRELSPRAEIA